MNITYKKKKFNTQQEETLESITDFVSIIACCIFCIICMLPCLISYKLTKKT